MITSHWKLSDKDWRPIDLRFSLCQVALANGLMACHWVRRIINVASSSLDDTRAAILRSIFTNDPINYKCLMLTEDFKKNIVCTQDVHHALTCKHLLFLFRIWWSIICRNKEYNILKRLFWSIWSAEKDLCSVYIFLWVFLVPETMISPNWSIFYPDITACNRKVGLSRGISERIYIDIFECAFTSSETTEFLKTRGFSAPERITEDMQFFMQIL